MHKTEWHKLANTPKSEIRPHKASNASEVKTAQFYTYDTMTIIRNHTDATKRHVKDTATLFATN